MKKQFILYLTIICIVVLAITGCIKFTQKIIKRESQYPEIIAKLNSPVSEQQAEKLKYPAKLKVDYHLPINSPLINDNVIYAFKGSGSDLWHITVLRKTKDGYIAEYGDDKNFLIEDPKDYGYNGYLKADKANGKFDITFYSEGGLDSFFDELDDNSEWKEPFLHMKKKEKTH